MHRLTSRGALLLLPLALAACGGRETSADSPQDSPRSGRGGIQVSGGEMRGDDSAPAAPLAGGDTALAVAVPGVQPAAPASQQPSAAPGSAASPAPSAPGAPAAQPAADGEKSAQDRAAEILRRAERVALGIRSMEADFVQTLNVPLLGTNQRSAGKMYQRRPDRFLMKFSDPAGDIMVADGRHFWIYYPSSDKTQVIRTSVAAGGEQADFQRQFLSGATQKYVATLNGEENVAGQAAWALTLVPRGESPYKVVRIWVGKGDDLVRRIEMTEENESVRTVELRNIRTNHTIPDALFSFTPPAGTQVFDQ